MPKKKLKGLKRALQTKDAIRLSGDIPLITDSTEMITPEMAEDMLRKNKNNRPVSWNKVEQYRKIMESGGWKFHAQGIVLDDKGNILTGQKRLWAVVQSGIAQPFRVSRGTPAEHANLIDRGTPQSSRDLASRKTARRHSPYEGTITRAILAAKGILKPTTDQIADTIVEYSNVLTYAMEQARRIKKTKAIMMTLGALCYLSNENDRTHNNKFGKMTEIADKLTQELNPIQPEDCWNKGAVFGAAIKKAIEICRKI